MLKLSFCYNEITKSERNSLAIMLSTGDRYQIVVECMKIKIKASNIWFNIGTFQFKIFSKILIKTRGNPIFSKYELNNIRP